MRGQHSAILFIPWLFLIYFFSVHSITSSVPKNQDFIFEQLTPRRILHQPLFTATDSPPSDPPPPPPPPPSNPSFPDPDQPFFPEVPQGPTPDQSQQSPPPTANGTAVTHPVPIQPQQTTPVKKVAIALSVGIVTLGMLSALAFYICKHRVKTPDDSHKLVGGEGGSSTEITGESRLPQSSFLYIGTVEPSAQTTLAQTNDANGSPYRKLNSIKRSDLYRPSPELQPLPPLTKPPPPPGINSPPPMSSSDEESHGSFYTPQGSSLSNEEGTYISRSRNTYRKFSRAGNQMNAQVPHSKRTSPKSRLAYSSTDKQKTVAPTINGSDCFPTPPKPLPIITNQDLLPEMHAGKQAFPYAPKRPKFSAPPPPPDFARLQRLSKQAHELSEASLPSPTRPAAAADPPHPPPPPPPPPPPLPPDINQKGFPNPVKPRLSSPSQQNAVSIAKPGPLKEISPSNRTSDRNDAPDIDGSRPKLKPLHWDKVRATSNRATVWDQLKSSSFQVNEDMMESLFGCNSNNMVPEEAKRKPILPPVQWENRVLDPKKSQNIAILLRALNVTREEVSEALIDGNPEGLGQELLETLVKMAPTKEEEIKLRDYNGDISRLGSAERFLKGILDIPFAFKRLEAMVYRANFDAEVKYLRKSFQTLEEASEELKNSRLFLKLLEAVLRTGNRMNTGTTRGDARAFKLDTLLKLVDVKGTDGKTTLLHFVVQEIIRSEGATNGDITNTSYLGAKDEEFRKQGLQVVGGLSRELGNVKKAAAMDSVVLSGYLSKIEKGLEKVTMVLQNEKPSTQGKFFESMKKFVKEAEREILIVKTEEQTALSSVKDVTEYFHGDAAKEEAHPFRIFMIVRDFLSVLDNVCKEVRTMHDHSMVVGTSRSFRIPANASLPVLNRYNAREEESSDEGSSS